MMMMVVMMLMMMIVMMMMIHEFRFFFLQIFFSISQSNFVKVVVAAEVSRNLNFFDRHPSVVQYLLTRPRDWASQQKLEMPNADEVFSGHKKYF